MKHMIHPRHLAALACLAAASSACHLAHAEAHSSLTLGNYQYTLIDLDPDDGIAPSVTWETGTLMQSLATSTSNGVGVGGGPNVVSHFSSDKSYQVPIGTAKSLSYQGFAVSSGSSGLSTSANIPVGGLWRLLTQYEQGFVLGAKTAISFTALAQSNLGVVVPPWSVTTEPYGYPNNGYFDWAPIQAETMAYIAVDTKLSESLGSSPPCLFDKCKTMDYLIDFMRSYETGSRVKDKQLSLTFSNESAAAESHVVSTVAYIDGYATAPLPMVPEPSTLSMICVGLAGIGLGWKRRQGLA